MLHAETPLHVETTGPEDGPIVLLLHGLSVNGAVWDGVRDRLAATHRVIVPDFAGHGLSPRVGNYSLGRHAVDVAAWLPAGSRVDIIGHSMGGAVGLILASGWFGITVTRTVTIGMKMSWTAEESLKMGRPFPVRRFGSRDKAAQRFLTVTGLAGLADADARVVRHGIVEDEGSWRLAADPEITRVVGPETPAIIAAARAGGAAIRLVCGTRDPLVTLPEMLAFDAEARTIEGGHNLPVEAPEDVAGLLGSFTSLSTP